jgi:Tfp pilus assembly protein PilE
MFCYKCGSEMSADAIFCEKCGTKVLSPPAANAVSQRPMAFDQWSGPKNVQQPGRGTLILILGILSLILLGPFTGIPAWVMGSKDLKKIARGIITISERGTTKAGLILGIIGTLLGVAVVGIGIAVAVGITMFSDSAIKADREAVRNDLENLASRAQQYYHRPTSLGGGGNSFNGLTADAAGIAKLTNKTTNGNGSYSIVIAGSGTGGDATVTLQGIGTEIFNGSPVCLRVRVWRDRDLVYVVN